MVVVADAIRLFPLSSQGLEAGRLVKVVQNMATFPPVPQVQSAFCPGVGQFFTVFNSVTRLHLLCY
jgi:hypothetical protein